MDFPWYENISLNNSLEQGDFIQNCPIVIPPIQFDSTEEIRVDVKLIDSIVLSQSCDLSNGKIELVLVSPYFTLKSFLDQILNGNDSQKAKRNLIDNLKKGQIHSYHLLNKTSQNEDYIVVDFRNVYGVQFEMLKQLALTFENRTRLLSPYREHLSQSFARYFMRVGLPQDLVIEGY